MDVAAKKDTKTAKRDTKTEILDAAQKLMAEHGINGVSLRSILTEAGANPEPNSTQPGRGRVAAYSARS